MSAHVLSTHYSSGERGDPHNHARLQIELFRQLKSNNQSNLDDTVSKLSELLQTPIEKPNKQHIKLIEGGVQGDRHCTLPKVMSNGFIRRRINEVNIFTSEELERLNSIFNTTVPPGGVGENILTKGIDIDILPFGTLLKIGSATVRIAGRRSFCFKFVGTFLKKELYKNTDFVKFNQEAIGMATQVIVPGDVFPGDKIEVITLGSGPAYRPNIRAIAGGPVKFELFQISDPTAPPIPFLNKIIDK
jgi:MOSC domain-containing protein YiiM